MTDTPAKPLSPAYNYRQLKRTMSDEEVVAAYLAGDDADTVGFKANISYATVLKIVHAAGVPLRRARTGPRGTPPKISEEEICRRYRGGANAPELGLLAGVSPDRIYRILERGGVDRRAPQASTRNTRRRQRAETSKP